jgi:phage shock protein A
MFNKKNRDAVISWCNYPLRFDPNNGVVDKREEKHEEVETMLRLELEEVKKELAQVKRERAALEKLLEEAEDAAG